MRSPVIRSGFFLVLMLLPGILGAQRAQVEVTLSLRAPASPEARVPVAVRAIPSSSLSPPGKLEPFEKKGTAPGVLALELDRSSLWTISADAEGHWIPDVLVAASNGDSAVTLDVWPAGKIEGLVQVPKGEKIPTELGIRFQSSPERGKAGLFGQQTFNCPVVEGSWSCRLPAGRLDLRLRARGFISHYRWGAVVKPGETVKLGSLALRRGASVVGKVEASEGAVSSKSCKVELSPLPAGLGNSQEEIRKRSGLALSLPVDEKGFFHFEGVPAGAYVLTAQQPGFAPAQIFPVTVLESAETEVREPLVLLKPVTLEASIDPPLDPWNQRWQVELEKRSAVPGSAETLGRSEARDDGRFTKEGLEPGDYFVTVQDSRGSAFASEEITLQAGSMPLSIRMPLVWVEGQLRLGKEPLEADLWFGGRNGRQSILLKSDSDGEIAGVLPREGVWEVDVQAASPAVRRRVLDVEVRLLEGASTAKVSVDLPDTRVSGEVVDEESSKMPGARVIAVELQTARPTFVDADEQGRFQLAGAPEGPLSLSASSKGLKSDEAVVDLVDGADPPPLRLVLRKLRELTGSVVSTTGGVPGARVFLVASTRDSSGFLPATSRAMTDAEGQFHLEIPASASDLQLIVLPPGFALSLQRLAGPPQNPLRILAEPQGGTLRLVPGRSAAEEDPRSELLSLWVNGVVVDSTLLGMWADMNGQRNLGSAELVVPQLPASGYTACWSSRAIFLQSLKAGISSPSAPCATGILSAGGELILERPDFEPKETPAGQR